MVDRLIRIGVWACVIGFAVYVIATRPGVAADAVHAVVAGVAAGFSAMATFLDDLIPKG